MKTIKGELLNHYSNMSIPGLMVTKTRVSHFYEIYNGYRTKDHMLIGSSFLRNFHIEDTIKQILMKEFYNDQN